MISRHERSAMLEKARINLIDIGALERIPEQLLKANTMLPDPRFIAGLESMHTGLDTLITRSFPSVDFDKTIPDILHATADIYYRLGETMWPFYARFTDWMHEQMSLIKQETAYDPMIIYDGRDSLGFAIAHAFRHTTPWYYSPGNRGSFSSFYVDDNTYTLNKLISKQRAEALSYQARKKLNGKDVVYVDFGFQGTHARLQNALAIEAKQPFRSLNVFLAVATKPERIFEANKIQDIHFNPNVRSEIERQDDIVSTRTAGYLNQLKYNGKTLPFLPQKTNPNPTNEAFVYALQELPSYILEARSDSLASPIMRDPSEIAVDSIHSIAAKYAFMQGLRHQLASNLDTNDSGVATCLTRFHQLVASLPDIFAIEDNHRKSAKSSEIYDLFFSLNVFLLSHNQATTL